MKVTFDLDGDVLRAAFGGAADSRKNGGKPVEGALRRIDEQVTVRRPSLVRLDFRGLEAIDGASFAKLSTEIERISKTAPVELIGPGPGMERLFGSIDPPAGWNWKNVADPGSEGPGGSAGSPPEGGDLFEIDLDIERLLLQGEPPGPEYDPMAEPLDLSGPGPGPKSAASLPADLPARSIAGDPEQAMKAPPAAPRRPPELEPDDPPADLRDQPEAGGEDEGPIVVLDLDLEEEMDLEEEIDGWFAQEGQDLEDDPLPDSTASEATGGDPAWKRADQGQEARSPGSPSSPILPGSRGPTLKDRLDDAEEALRAHIATLEAEKLSLLRRIVGVGGPEGTSPPISYPLSRTLRENGPSRQELSTVDSLPASPPDEGAIPPFLRGHALRGKILRAFAVVLERERSGRTVPGIVLQRLGAALVGIVQRAPFALFDLTEAREGPSPSATGVSTTAMALAMAVRAGATLGRLRSLALTGLLAAIFGPPGRTTAEIPEGRDGLRTLARRIHRKMIEIAGGESLRAPVREVDVREDLLLVSLVREYWRRIGPPPEGGADPAMIAIALARAEIGDRYPKRLRRLFLETFSAFPPGTWVRMESGEVGVSVAPGSRGPGSPMVLVLLAGKEGGLRDRPPRLVDTGLAPSDRVRAIVRCPIGRCPAPRPVARISEKVTA